MTERSLATLRQILHAAARVLGCGAAQMALLDEEQQRLVLRVTVANQDVPRLAAVESTMGFAADGASITLSASESLLVRTVREGRLFVTGRFAELARGLLPDEVVRGIAELIGPQTFASVPVLGRSGAVGVLLFEKPGDGGFAPADRDLLVAYADRVGAEIEAHSLTDDVAALESLSDLGAPPPTLWSCRLTGSGIAIDEGEAAGQSLEQVLDVRAEPGVLRDAALRARDSGKPVMVRLAGPDQRGVRLTLRPLGEHDALVVASEVAGWPERLGQAAARARDHLTKVLSALDEAILTVDTSGVIVASNAAVRKIFGCSPADLLGRPVVELLADRRGRTRMQRMAEQVAETGFAEAELRFRKGSAAIPAAVSALALADDHGRPTGAVWRVQDLSERRRGDAERRRLRARLLQTERLSALGEMAARIAHEVRNPLVSISAAAQVIQEELPTDSPVIDDARAIVREVRRLDAILSDFLRFARPRQAVRRRVALDPLLAETIEMVRARAEQLGVGLVLQKSEPAAVRCDGDAVRQVLWNVLLNAIEASPRGASVECRLERGQGRVRIAIDDHGPGVAPEARQRAFDPFFSTKARGTGLGLAVSKQIIEEHRGRIRLVSPKQGGTRVVIELPE